MKFNRHRLDTWWALRPWRTRAILMPVCSCECICMRGPLTGEDIAIGLCGECQHGYRHG